MHTHTHTFTHTDIPYSSFPLLRSLQFGFVMMATSVVALMFTRDPRKHMRACIHTYIHPHIPTYVRTYIHTDT